MTTEPSELERSKLEPSKSEPSKLARNILSQADSLARVLGHQCGPGQKPLLEAAKRIALARRVLITGMGASQIASLPLEYGLCRQGIDAAIVEAGELLHYRHPAFRDSVFVVVSRSGESIEIVKLLELFKDKRTIVGVTNEPGSTLAKAADCPIIVGSMADEMVAIQTYTGTLLAMHLLGGAIAGRLDVVQSELSGLQSQFAQFVTECMERAAEWDILLDPERPVHLLARGPSCASALEGALLFNEVAKLPAVGSSIASFRHGPAEIVDREFRGILFAAEGPTRELTCALGRDLIRFGGHIAFVGSRPDLAGSRPSWRIPDVSDGLAPLFEVVPIQIAALRMAEVRGIAPGSFRHTPQVSVSEESFDQV